MRWIFTAIFAAAVSITTPVTAQTRSDCPVASDLGKGIQLTRQSPLFDMTLQRDGAIVTENRAAEGFSGKRRKVLTTYLDGLVPLVRREGRQVIRQKLSNNTRIVSGGRVRNWNSPIEITVGNRVYGSGTIKVRRAGKATWTGNNCRYDVTRVIVTTEITGRDASHFEYFYAPALGISLGSYKLASDGRTRRSGVLPERIARR